MEQLIPNIGPMPAIGLGTWQLGGLECTNTVKAALELGYRHIDTAHVYNNHGAIAQAIKDFPREQLFLVSKIIEQDLHPQKVSKACERCLKELKTPYLDLLLIHWPSEAIPAVQTLEVMSVLKEKGLIRHFGVSNFMRDDLEKIASRHFPILANQIELHPYLQEKDLVNYCQQLNIIAVAYRPIQRAQVNKDKKLIEIGEKYHKTPIQVTLRWIYQRGIASIPKATSVEHLHENLAIFDFALSDEDMQAISALDANQRYVV